MAQAESFNITHDMASTIVDPAAYAYAESAAADDVFAWLRANNHIGLAHPEGFDPFWIATKYETIKKIGSDGQLFTSGERASTLLDRESAAKIREMTGGRPNLTSSIVQLDDPEHAKLRQVTQAWFLPRNIQTLRDAVREIARSYVDQMLEAGDAIDFAASISQHYPLSVIMLIMGIPSEDKPFLLKLTQEIFGPADPELQRRPGFGDGPGGFAKVRAAAMGDLAEYFQKLLEERRRNPKDDVATLIAQGRVDGELISTRAVIDYYITMATAGHDSTAASLGGALHGLCRFPDEFAKVKANPALLPHLADEAVRWTTPFRHFMRGVSEDTEIDGRLLRKGDSVMLCYMSGNRDEEVFQDPFVFKADRSPNRHVGYGHGPHNCLGQHLAKAEIQIFMEELLPRISGMDLIDEPRLTLSYMVSRLKSLPIRLH